MVRCVHELNCAAGNPARSEGRYGRGERHRLALTYGTGAGSQVGSRIRIGRWEGDAPDLAVPIVREQQIAVGGQRHANRPIDGRVDGRAIVAVGGTDAA